MFICHLRVGLKTQLFPVSLGKDGQYQTRSPNCPSLDNLFFLILHIEKLIYGREGWVPHSSSRLLEVWRMAYIKLLPQP